MFVRRPMRFFCLASILLATNVSAAQRAPIGVSPSAVSVLLGGTQQFTASVSSGVEWSASAGTISAAGLFTAPTSMPASPTVVIKASKSSRTGTATVTLALLKPQKIKFPNPGTQTVGTPLTLSATASSGLAVSFASQTTSVCTVSGTKATFVTAGTCTIQASQAGNGTWAAATPVSRSFTVNLAKPTITSFTATPSAVNLGSASALHWVTTGAASIAITPGTFTSALASGSTSVSPASTTTYTLTATNTAGSVTATAQVTVNTGGPLTITTVSCPDGTQGSSYAGCAINATGGTPPYTFSVSTSGSYPPLPEGMSLNSSTGAVTSSQIGGQGTYTTEFVVEDAANTTATLPISFAQSPVLGQSAAS